MQYVIYVCPTLCYKHAKISRSKFICLRRLRVLVLVRTSSIFVDTLNVSWQISSTLADSSITSCLFLSNLFFSHRCILLVCITHWLTDWLTCLFVCVGPRKRVYCSLQAYCPYPMCVQCSHFYRQEAPRHNDAGDPSSEMCNLLGEKLPVIWPNVASSTLL
jgi:hypothetical protein